LCLRLAGDREGWSRLLDEVDANPGDPRINDEVKIMVAVARSDEARGWLTDLQAALDRRPSRRTGRGRFQNAHDLKLQLLWLTGAGAENPDH